MRVRLALTAILLMTAALAACGKKTQDADGKVPSQEPASAPAQAAPPKPRAGLWQETVSAEGVKRVMKICMDQAFVDQSKWVASNLMAKGCTSSTSPIAGGWAFKSECDMGSGGRIATEGQATGDFTSHYVVKSSSTTSGAALAQMNRTSSAEVTLDYQGPCPQGWAGGDVEMPGVGRISTGAMMKQAAPSK